MPLGTPLIAVVVYCIIAWISSSARYTGAIRSGEAIVFPLQTSAKLLLWFGGMFCVAFGAYCLVSGYQVILNVCFLCLGLVTLFIPLRPLAVNPSGVEAPQALWWKKRVFTWREIDRVEVWKAGRMVVLVHGKLSITHSRYHVDQDEFIRLIKAHVASDKWIIKRNF